MCVYVCCMFVCVWCVCVCLCVCVSVCLCLWCVRVCDGLMTIWMHQCMQWWSDANPPNLWMHCAYTAVGEAGRGLPVGGTTPPTHPYTHTPMHSCTHTPHTHTHPCTHTPALTCTHTSAHTYTHAPIQPDIYTYTRPYIQPINTPTLIHTHTHTSAEHCYKKLTGPRLMHLIHMHQSNMSVHP